MPALPPLALRYLLWLIGLRIVYIVAVNVTGIPNALATTVILASVPAMDIGMQAVRRATGPLGLQGWVTIWGVMISVYLIVNVMIPAMLVPGFRDVMADPVGLRSVGLVSLAVAVMLGLFLFIGSRLRRG